MCKIVALHVEKGMDGGNLYRRGINLPSNNSAKMSDQRLRAYLQLALAALRGHEHTCEHALCRVAGFFPTGRFGYCVILTAPRRGFECPTKAGDEAPPVGHRKRCRWTRSENKTRVVVFGERLQRQ